MWVAKLKGETEGSIFGPRTKKYNLTVIGYPMNYYKKNNKYFFTGAGYFLGEEENKKEFLKDLKKDKRIIKLERKGNFFTSLYSQKGRLGPFYDPELIFVKPVVIDSEGYETWEIGSWNKKKLVSLAKHTEKAYKGYNIKLLKLKEEKIDNIFVHHVLPNLTKKQEKAIELAIKNGYYEYPREIELEKLAKLMKISYSTYQAHLRKAEKKLLPFFFENK